MWLELGLFECDILENQSFSLQFSFFLLSSFIFLSHAKLYLDHSDYNTVKIIQRDLGIDSHHPSYTTTPCNASVIFCERRVANYTSILKITRIIYDSELLEGFISPVISQLSEIKELTLTSNHFADQLPKKSLSARNLRFSNSRIIIFQGNCHMNCQNSCVLEFLTWQPIANNLSTVNKAQSRVTRTITTYRVNKRLFKKN